MGELELRSGTYRCPVCGHRESTDVDTESNRVLVSCPYCDTRLEVTAKNGESVRFEAQVAEEAGG